MALEQDIANLVQAANHLTGVVDNKVGEIDQRVETAEQDISDYLESAKAGYGHICTTPNQAMAPNSTNTGIEGLSHIFMDLDVTMEKQFKSGWPSYPTAASEEFANSVGIKYSNATFNLVRVSWSNAHTSGHPSRFHNSFSDGNSQGSFTEAAYIKVIAGSIGGDFKLKKSYPNDWGLFGRYARNNPFGANHNGLVLTSESGEMLIALYGKATGIVDLENGQWGLFPSLNS